MEKLQFFYFPFAIGDEEGEVIPKFSLEDVRKLASQNHLFRLKIVGDKEPHPSLIDINQVATYIEDALELENLEWNYTGTDTYKSRTAKELIALLYMRECDMDAQDEIESELHQFTKTASPLFDYLVSQLSEHGLVSNEFWIKLHSLGIKENKNILYQLISIRDDILLLHEDRQYEFDQTLELLEQDLLMADNLLRSSMFSLMEDNSFTSARQVILLMELTYLFSLFLYGLSNFDLLEFMSKTKSFLSSLNPDSLTKVELPYLGQTNLFDDPFYPF